MACLQESLNYYPGSGLYCLHIFFNIIFFTRVYPKEWSRAKLCRIFKKGDKNDVTNYRGISIINSMAKLYDMVLCSRLKLV